MTTSSRAASRTRRHLPGGARGRDRPAGFDPAQLRRPASRSDDGVTDARVHRLPQRHRISPPRSSTVVVEPPGEDQADGAIAASPSTSTATGVDDGRITTVDGTGPRSPGRWPTVPQRASPGTTVSPRPTSWRYGTGIFERRGSTRRRPSRPRRVSPNVSLDGPVRPGPDQSSLTTRRRRCIDPHHDDQPPGLLRPPPEASDLDHGGRPCRHVPLGDSFLGPGRAIACARRPGHAYALVLTDSGLTIEISTELTSAPTS